MPYNIDIDHVYILDAGKPISQAAIFEGTPIEVYRWLKNAPLPWASYDVYDFVYGYRKAKDFMDYMTPAEEAKETINHNKDKPIKIKHADLVSVIAVDAPTSAAMVYQGNAQEARLWLYTRIIIPWDTWKVHLVEKNEYISIEEFMKTMDSWEPEVEEKVNHPAHYNTYKGIEIIDLVEQMNFNRGNAVKYIARAGFKDPEKELEDLKKAQWYITREIERIGASATEEAPEKEDILFCNLPKPAHTAIGNHLHICGYDAPRSEYDVNHAHKCYCGEVWQVLNNTPAEKSEPKLIHVCNMTAKNLLSGSHDHLCKFTTTSQEEFAAHTTHKCEFCTASWTINRNIDLDRLAVLCDLQIALRDNEPLRDFVHGWAESSGFRTTEDYHNRHNLKGSIVTFKSKEDRSFVSSSVGMDLPTGSIAVRYGTEYSGHTFTHSEYCSLGCQGY